ncbi:MAG: dTDP-4-dehydrorhamnose 3,5-epimerase family protein [Parcubacteria group bacterium]|nr:dTDP-4-dehydrorhamnose 3,5-epimerase family protein [Parcubacteria group bacterium]
MIEVIDGVKIKKVVQHRDDRGFFAELVKFGEETFQEIKQTSYSETKPGIIKAFHIHNYWEVWCVIKGKAQVVLHDLRENSATKGEAQIIYTGEDNMLVIAIPPNVAHGYKALGDSPMGIIYHAAEPFDSSKKQIEHIPFDSPDINFNWLDSND